MADIDMPQYQEAEEAEQPLVLPNILNKHADVVGGLVEAYMDKLHPVMPFFHTRTLNTAMENRLHTTNFPFAVCLLALCTLAASRLNDGAFALENPLDPNLAALFFCVSEQYDPRDFRTIVGGDSLLIIEWMRTWVLLALYGLQIGSSYVVHKYMGYFTTMVACHRLHDERYWPSVWTLVETETAKRLIWGAYMIEIQSSVVFGSMPRLRGREMSVRLPTQVRIDNIIGGNGYSKTIVPGTPLSWLNPWNRTVEVYILMEGAVTMKQPVKQAEIQKLQKEIEALERKGRYPEPSDLAYDTELAYANFYTTQFMVDVWAMKASPLPAIPVLRYFVERLGGMCTVRSACLFAPILPLIGGLGSILAKMVQGSHKYTVWCEISNQIIGLGNIIEKLPKSNNSPLMGKANAIKVFGSEAYKWCHSEFEFPWRKLPEGSFGQKLKDKLPLNRDPDRLLTMPTNMTEGLVWPLEVCEEARLNDFEF
ncbi:hypothetical protein HYFRA_00001226 [Hymenoscyphus fraxineus]|uniref:Xylanolytic transcriptional activator regulatory domain-containing protein n=1 Tax=Hymenoscyphus fraxineus TaxID=746836 RepID=A0A9N9KS34_9HELO|nr:hypothetical protein HYFRA_00001226 [Hymenoscyphus fraxineus]